MSNTWLFFPATETVLDTYTQSGSLWRWRSANNWWNGIASGTWSSTGTTTGSYLKLDSGSRIGVTNIVFSADDPNQGGLPADAEVRVTVTPSSGGVKKTIRGTNAGAGDSVWTWIDSAGNGVVHSVADMEAGGNWGWDQTDSLTIEIVDPA